MTDKAPDEFPLGKSRTARKTDMVLTSCPPKHKCGECGVIWGYREKRPDCTSYDCPALGLYYGAEVRERAQ